MYKKDLLLTDSKRNRFSLIYEFSYPLAMCEEMLEAGINIPMVRKYMSNSVADSMQKFCKEHGLI